ncbi:MAG: hypothetical protein ABI898_01090 [Sphingomonadales bacterium]
MTRVSFVAILPVLIVGIAPAIFGWRIISPGESASSADLHEAAKVLGELSTDLSSIAVAVLVGLGILARERARRALSDRFLLVTIACAFFAILSVYASIRLRLGVAVQMLGMGFYFGKLVEQLLAQALALVIALSLLVSIAASAIFGLEDEKP